MFMRTDGRKDGQTDMTKLIGAFRNFAKSAKKRIPMCNPNHVYWNSNGETLNWRFSYSTTAGELNKLDFGILAQYDSKWKYNEAVHQLFIDIKMAYDSARREVLCKFLIEFGIYM
jgi:hypothetical protein